MFHETVSRKLLVFTLYVYPYMSKGVFHLNLLDELITTFGVLFSVFFFLFKFLANNSGEPDPTPPWLCGVLSGFALFANVPKWRQGVNELNTTPRVLKITSRNFRKRKNLECNL